MIRLKEFFDNTNILVTGGTGFIGKVLIEKLLRSQTNVNKIYILIRSKKGKLVDDRAKTEIFDKPIFDNIKKHNPNFMEKIVLLEGDIVQDKLGLKQDDIDLIKAEVNIVFQVAASVNMRAPLKYNAEKNFYSVLELLGICRQIKHLKSLVIVSTAYSNCNRGVIEEKVYKSSISPDLAATLIREIDDDILVKMTESLQNGLPNTYTLSKSFMENALLDYQDLPIVLFRPGIIIPSIYEPLPGWIDSFNGPAGLFAIGGVGIFRVINSDLQKNTSLVPVDFCVNALICSAWHGTESRLGNNNEMMIYNYTLNDYRRSWKSYLENITACSVKSSKCVWYPKPIYIKSSLLYTIFGFLIQILPAMFLDCLLALSGNKFRLTRLLKEKIYPGLKVLSFFYHNEWIFKEDNVKYMLNSLSEEEKSVYAFDMGEVNFEEFIYNLTVGLKVFLLKEKMEDNDAALEGYPLRDCICVCDPLILDIV